jgi:hypothetical protein
MMRDVYHNFADSFRSVLRQGLFNLRFSHMGHWLLTTTRVMVRFFPTEKIPTAQQVNSNLFSYALIIYPEYNGWSLYGLAIVWHVFD